MIPHCHLKYSHRKTYISYVIISEYSIRQDKTSKGEDSIHHNKSIEGKTPYDPTILTKLAIHQDRDISRTQERERERD